MRNGPVDIKAMLALNKERKNKYFRTYDPVRGDPDGEVVPRCRLVIEGETFFVPLQMLADDFVKAYLKYRGAKGLLEATGQPVTESNITAVTEHLYKLRLKYDFEFCAATTIKIQDKETKRYIPLYLNEGQRILIGEYERQRLEGVPIRVLLVKARQWGGSTATQCYMFWLQRYWFENWHSCIVALNQTQAVNIRTMYKNLVAKLPDWSEPVTFKRFEGTELIRIIPERGCRVQIGSATKPDALRSFDFSLVHMSEVGLWKDTKEAKGDDVAMALYSTVPDVPGTMIVMESTAKGVGNYFHRQYLAALDNKKKGVTGIRPVFVAWYVDARYTTPYFNRYGSTEEFVATWSEYNWWQWEQGATLDGIYWYNQYKQSRHWTDFQMKSEYPTTAEEAFQTKSGRYFTDEMLSWLKKSVRAPKFVGDIRGDATIGEKALQNVKLYPNDSLETEVLKIWIMPTDGAPAGKKVKNRFIVTVDVGGRGYRSDWSVISVCDRISLAGDFGALERAALWRGHVDPDILAYKAAQIATFYDDALLVIESNTYDTKNKKSDDADKSEGDHTYTVLDTLGGLYENLYRRRTAPDNTRDRETRHIGWHMNKQSKYQAYDDYSIRIREGDYMEYSQDAADEAMWLMNVPGGKIEAMEGTHDDIQDTTAVANYISFGSMPPVKIVEETPTRASSTVRSRTGGGESSF
jgi:hypothetical protein